MEDPVVKVILFAVMLGCGVLLLWMARAAASGRLKRNSIAGIRIASTLASDDAWLAAHRRAERPTMAAGLVAIVSGVIALLPLSDVVIGVGILVGCVGMLGFVLYGARLGNQAARAALARGGSAGDN